MRTLRPYQQNALSYALNVQNPSLFVQMRLGKTIITIRGIKLKARTQATPDFRVLVVAPSSALGSWEEELLLEGEDDIIFLQGTRSERHRRLNAGYRWNLINKEGFLSLPEIACIRWEAVVCDESPWLKDPRSKVSQFFCGTGYYNKGNFAEVHQKWILTGTPNPESDLDFFQQLLFLDGREVGAFGCKDFYSFRIKYFSPDPFGRWWPKRGTKEMIRNFVARRCLVLRRKDVNLEQPKIYSKRFIDMPKKIRKLYDGVEEDFAYAATETTSALVQHTWMRRMAGGFNPDTGELLWKEKFVELLHLLQGELAEESVVIWFAFTNEINAAETLLKRHKVSCEKVYGVHPPYERRKRFAEFQRGNIRVLLLQTMIAQYGLDLSSASTAIYYSNHYSRTYRTQSEDRILVAGDKHPLLYIDLITRNSVDSDILKLLRKKERRAIEIMELAHAMQQRLKRIASPH